MQNCLKDLKLNQRKMVKDWTEKNFGNICENTSRKLHKHSKKYRSFPEGKKQNINIKIKIKKLNYRAEQNNLKVLGRKFFFGK